MKKAHALSDEATNSIRRFTLNHNSTQSINSMTLEPMTTNERYDSSPAHKPKPFYWLLLVALLLMGAISPTIQAQDYQYADKLYGKQFTFTPKADEVMVRFAPQAGKTQVQSAEELGRSYSLELLQGEGLDEYQFAVYRTTAAGKTASSAVAELQNAPAVAAVYPAMIDQDGLTRYFLPDQITVQFRKTLPESEMMQIIESAGYTVAIDHWTPGYYTLTIPAGADVFEQVNAMIDVPQVQFSELSFISFNDEMFVPNDPLYAQQWYLHNDGTNATGATADADADLRDAWDIERGDPNIIVAVIDSGVDWDHPDLDQNILINNGEDINGNGVFDNSPAPGGDLDGIDNDGNGLIDDVAGWDFANNDADPNPSTNAHGTAVAGIIAAEADNNLGVAGAAHGVRILPLRINLSAGMNQNRADAINYAVNEAAKYGGMVLNNSWRASGDMTAIQTAVQNARTAGVLPVFAAGNFNTSPVNFPAQYDETMAVASTSPCDTRKRSSSDPTEVNPGVSTDPLGTSCDGEDWWGSNFGDDLNIAAPGVLMVTTDIEGTGGYENDDYVDDFNGTSSAAPLTSAIAALVLSHHLEISAGEPMLTPDELEDILESSADKIGGYDYNYDASRPGYSLDLGAGRINALRALQELIARKVGAFAAPPIDIALSIDRSGSMGPPLASAEKFDAAKNAAAQVVRMMNNGDRIAVTSYSSAATTNFGITTIASDADRNNAITSINALVHGGGTSIGGGLLEAQGELLGAFPPQPQSIILMSDGQSNVGPFVDPVLDAGVINATTYTIGFGTPGFDIDEDTLQTIASQTGGQYFFSGAEGVSKSNAFSEGALTLIKGYQSSFHKASQRQMIKLLARYFEGEEVVEAVPVDAASDEVRFSLLWDTRQSGAYDLVLEDPNGNIIDPSEAASNPLVEYIEDKTVEAYNVQKPQPGVWYMRARALKQYEKARVHFSAASYSTCRLVLQIVDHGRGLTVEVKPLLNGLPVHGATVYGAMHTPSGRIIDFKMNDGGGEGDNREGDGVYSFTFPELKEVGSYTFEAYAQGLDAKGYPYARYDVASQFVGKRKPVQIELPNYLAPAGARINVPIFVNTVIDPLDKFQDFQTLIEYDEKILRFAGEVTHKSTMSEDWKCGVEPVQNGVLLLECKGPALEGTGHLLQLPFDVDSGAKTGDTSKLIFADFKHGGQVAVETANGSFTVGSTLLDEASFKLKFPKGWNLASMGVELPEGVSLGSLFPSLKSALGYEPGKGFVQVDHIGPTEGVMMYLGEDETVEMIGKPTVAYTKALEQGWNLIGGLASEPAQIEVSPKGALASALRFDSKRGYVLIGKEGLPVGEGALVYCTKACKVSVSPVKGKLDRGGKQESAPTMLVLEAIGEAAPGFVQTSQVVIGLEDEANRLPYPPMMAERTASLRLLNPDDASEALFSDFRDASQGAGNIKWVLEVDPNGSSKEARATLLSWNSEALSNLSKGTWSLRKGRDGSGEVVIDDMRTAGGFTVSGREVQYFTISASLSGDAPGDAILPSRHALQANYPNPFNPETTIRFEMPASGQVTVKVYNTLGQLVQTLVEGAIDAGSHTVTWNGRDHAGQTVPSGMYFYRMDAAGFSDTRQMILLK